MNQVFVLDHHEQPLMPTHPARARQLLRTGKAAIYRRYPMTIILKERTGGATQPVELKLDPGSKTTGIALVAHGQAGARVIWAGELQHRGQIIRERLTKRLAVRRGRRQRHCRYRPRRFDNRRRPEGWLPPSLRSRVDNVKTWAERLGRLAPICAVAIETVRFDTQQMQNPEISGIEYQQGELAGYEVREYLLEKWQRKCAYCGAINTPLEVEHITPRSRGGSNRVSNLTIACRRCNQEKGNRTAAEYGHPQVQAQARLPLKDAAAVNATRYAIGRAVQALGRPTTFWSGGRTKWNRRSQGYEKAHWIDAACVGETGAQVIIPAGLAPLLIRATGRGCRQMCKMDRYGFPRSGPKTVKRVHGFQTGDMVLAQVPTGKHAGQHVGRVAVRASGRFLLSDGAESNWKHCRLLQRADGYEYSYSEVRR